MQSQSTFRNMLLAVAISLAAATTWVATATARPSDEKSATLLDEAREYFAAEKYSAAVIQLKNLLRANPDHVEARFFLGEVYLKLGDVPSAEKEFRMAWDRGMQTSAVKLRLGQSLLLQGKFEELLNTIMVEEFEPEAQPDAYVLIGRAQVGTRQLDLARENFEKAEKLRPEGVQAKLGLARLDAEAGRLDRAEALVDRALALSPRLPNALLLKGEFARLRRDLAGALEYFNSVVEIQPRNVAGLLGRAATLIDLNRDDEALPDIEAVFELLPNHPLANYFMAMTFTKKGDFQTANELLQKTGAMLESYLPGFYLKGVVHYGLRNFEQAQINLSRFLTALPGHQVARRLLGAAQVRTGEHATALETLKPLMSESSNDARLNALIGAAYMGIGDFSNATLYFEKAAASEPQQSVLQTQLALSKLATGDTEGAVADLESMVDINPEAGQASVLLALVALRQQEFDRALEVSRELLKNHPENPMAANLIGAALLGKGDAEGARQAFEQALQLRPDYFPAMTNLAQMDVAQNKLDDARKKYLEILDQNQGYLVALFGLADLALRNNDRAAAEGWLERAVSLNSSTVTAGLRLAGFYLSGGEYVKAMATARQLTLSFPDNASALETLGKAQAAAGEAASAAVTFQKLAGLAPRSPQVHNWAGRAQAASSDLDGARKSFNAALEINPGFIPAVEGLAVLEAGERNFDRALEIVRNFRDLNPDSEVGDVLVGDIYMRMDRPDEAVTAYRRAKEKAMSDMLALRLYGALTKQGEMEAAIVELKQWVAANPDSVPGRHALANAYLETEKLALAIDEYEALRQVDEINKVMILNNLAWLYQKLGDPRAAPTAEEALALAPNSAPVNDTLGWIVLEAGEKTRSLDLLRKANALAPDEPDIRYHLAVALEKNGRRDEALRELRSLLSMGKTFENVDEAKSLLDRLSRGE